MLFLALLTLFATVIGTITGFGTATVMTPILAAWYSPIESILLIAVIHWFGDIWKIALFAESGIDFSLVLSFGLIGLATSYLGAHISVKISEHLLRLLLGVFLMGYSLFLILRPRSKLPVGNFFALLGGALSGFFSGILGMGGAVRGAFLTAFNLPKARYIATSGAIALLVDSTRIITYIVEGTTLAQETWQMLGVLVPISFIGALIAQRITKKLPERAFRSVIALFLLLIGLRLVVLGLY